MSTLKSLAYLFVILWKEYKVYYLYSLLLIIIQPVLNIIQVGMPSLLVTFLTESQLSKAIYTVLLMCISISLIIIFQSFFSYKNTLINQKFNIRLNCLLSQKALSIDYQKFEEFKTREEYQFAVKCTKEGTAEQVINSIITAIGALFSFIGVLYITSYIVWWIWGIIVLSVAINAVCEYFRAKYNYGSYKQQNTVEMRMLYARDRLTWKSFAKEVRLFGMYDFVTNTALRYINALADIQKKRAGKTFFVLSFTFIINAVQMITVYGFVAYKCYNGEFSIGDFTMLSFAMLSIADTTSSIATGIVNIREQSEYINSFVSFLTYRTNSASKSVSIDCRSSIVFNNVCFSYPGKETTALEMVNFSFDLSKKYGIVGANGSGKSTMIKLLMGLYSPDSGQILLNKTPITDIEQEQYFGLFSPVMQDFNIYAYTIEENIALNNNVEKNKVAKKLKAINFLDKINSLDHKADTYITTEYDDSGTELSGGELQKIAIARAMYKDAPIFVLDEPSSALSPQSEYELYQTINQNLNDKTIFFISHRMASCRMCDEIIVFDNGKIVENGTHDELMQKNGIYHEMFSAQSSLYSEVGV